MDLVKNFGEIVKVKPQEIAVQTSEKAYSYEYIDIWSDVVSTIIERNIDKSEQKVIAVLSSRSENYLIILMGILKAGLAFLPIDINIPQKRISSILSEGGIEYFFTDQELSIVSDLIEKKEGIELRKNHADANFKKTVYQDNLAYVIFTSGSTGVPKGVKITREALNTFSTEFSQKIDYIENNSILALASFSFDISIFETIISLSIGKRIIMVTDYEKKHPQRIYDLIIDKKPEVLQITPSYLSYIEKYDSTLQCLNFVKKIILGGESIPYATVKKLQCFKHLKKINAYGPTEATIWCIVGEIDDCNCIHAGKPLNSVKTLIINDSKECQKGELLLSGPTITVGYTNNRNDSFVVYNDAIYYKTGDIVEINENGDYVILGRLDEQVKVNGYRIELGDIESNILLSGFVDDVCVILYENKIIAFVKTKRFFEDRSLMKYLEKNLPNYMIPNEFFKIEKIPININGKKDRKRVLALYIEQEIKENVNDSLTTNKINYWEKTLRENGIGSLDFINIIVNIEKKYEVVFDDDALVMEFFNSANELISYIESLLSKRENS